MAPQSSPAGTLYAVPGAYLNEHPALRAQFDAQLQMLGALALRGCDLLGHLGALQLGVARTLSVNGIDACRAALACDDPSRAAAVALQQLQPSGETVQQWQNAVMGLMLDAQAVLPGAGGAPPRR